MHVRKIRAPVKITLPRDPPPNKLLDCRGREGVSIRIPDQLQRVVRGDPLVIIFVVQPIVVALGKTG